MPGNVLLAFSAKMSDVKVRVDAVMGEIERDVRDRLAAPAQGAVPPTIRIRRSSTRFTPCCPARGRPRSRLDAAPELVDGDVDWRCTPHLTTHRPAAGKFILFAKKKLLLPLTRWLFEYSQENFRRQDHLNRVLFCLHRAADARLRRDLAKRS